MRQTRAQAAEKRADKITKVPDAIFDVVAKDKKKKHVAEDVREAAVHEHRSDQREVNGNRRRLQTNSTNGSTAKVFDDYRLLYIFVMNDFVRDSRKRVGEFIVRPKPLQEHEHEDVREDENVINYRRRAAIGVVVGDRKKHF